MITVVHIRDKQPGDRYIGRGSPFGNPFRIGPDGDREQVILEYRQWITAPKQSALLERARQELPGKRLVCFCKPLACHGDVLKELIEE